MILWWLLGFVGIIVTLSTNKYLPAELSGYLETKGTAEMSQFEITALIVGFLLLFALIISSAGLLFFQIVVTRRLLSNSCALLSSYAFFWSYCNV